MAEEEKKAINELYIKAITSSIEAENYPNMICMKKDMIIALNLIKKQQAEIEKKDKIIDEIKEYANWHIEHLTDTIADYIDDDKIGNAQHIGEMKEEREHWKDILRIVDNEDTYIDYKNW